MYKAPRSTAGKEQNFRLAPKAHAEIEGEHEELYRDYVGDSSFSFKSEWLLLTVFGKYFCCKARDTFNTF